ncbi:MAG: hypothetical protein JRD89_01385 [Deltaproteobacteria bacterium]|nr:hypothetical protein [Deltaproteobacteria bacterium]
MHYDLENSFVVHGLHFEKVNGTKGKGKYRVTKDFEFPTELRPIHLVGTLGASISPEGVLTLHKGMLFDPSGPTFDDMRNLLASALHDGGYEMLKAGAIGQPVPNCIQDRVLKNHDRCRKWFDCLYSDVLAVSWPMYQPKDPGFFVRRWLGFKGLLRTLRRKANYAGVRIGGASSAELAK